MWMEVGVEGGEQKEKDNRIKINAMGAIFKRLNEKQHWTEQKKKNA